MTKSESNVSSLWSTTIRHPDWYYVSLEFQPSPSQTIESVDAITWKSLINMALKQLHGVLGESVYYDIIHLITSTEKEQSQLQKKTPFHRAIVRVTTDDREIFLNSMIAAVFSKVDTMGLGLAQGTSACLRVISSSQYLAGVSGPDRYHWY